jgi:gamma-glutamyltranspeptidase/glutathione hydrolase
VVHPEAGNIGGGGFMVIRMADGTVQTLDYRETAPARATRDMYLDEHGEPTERSVTGHLAAGVPGAVAGLTEAHARLGRLPLARIMAPAIGLARDDSRWTGAAANPSPETGGLALFPPRGRSSRPGRPPAPEHAAPARLA